MNYNRNDVYYWFIIGMLGLTMYWVYIVVAPTFEIATKTNTLLNKMDTVLNQGLEQNNLTIAQNQKIIENQNTNGENIRTVIKQIEATRQNQINYLFAVLNQSNVIGNATADLILESIANVQELEDNQTQNSKKILKVLAENRNITLSGNSIGNEFELFRPAAVVARPNIEPLEDIEQQQEQENIDVENQTGNISGFLGGPLLILNQTIPSGNTSGYLGGPVIVINETNTIPSNQTKNQTNSTG
jgi:hypothetical protein